MLKEMLRESSCQTQTAVELCSDFPLTFGFLTEHIKAWLQALLRKYLPSCARLPGWGRNNSFVKVAACSEAEQYLQAVDVAVGYGWGCLAWSTV